MLKYKALGENFFLSSWGPISGAIVGYRGRVGEKKLLLQGEMVCAIDEVEGLVGHLAYYCFPGSGQPCI
jgi:hypothetical protein